MSTNDLTATETWMKFAFAGEYLVTLVELHHTPQNQRHTHK